MSEAPEGKVIEIAPRFRLRPFDQITAGSLQAYLVKGIIPRTGLVVIWGPPKCGKSFWTFDLVMHAALGWEYRGRRVHQGPVVYIALEGAEGFRARVEAFRQRFMSETPDTVPFYLIADQLNLVKDQAELIGCIRVQAQGSLPAAVVIDTLNRSLAGSESDDKDMAAYIRAADAIRDAFGCVVIIVHHCGIDATRPRGHTSLAGAVDAQIAVKRDTADNILVTVERMKDGPEGEQIVSKLETVEVGIDPDGDPLTSCVIVPSEAVKPDGDGRKKMSPKYELAFRALIELAADGIAPSPSWGLPASVRTISAECWKAKLLSNGVIDAGKDMHKRFWDIKNALKAKNIVGERDGSVWPAA
jgi:AAA domain